MQFIDRAAPVTRSGPRSEISDPDWFAENSTRFLRLRYGIGQEPDLLLAFHPHAAGPIHILAVPEGMEPQSWLLDGRTSYDDVWLAFPAFQALAGRHLLRSKLAVCLQQGGRLSREWTAVDYRTGEPRHNAQVFDYIWHHTLIGVDEEGIFECSDGSAGTINFGDVVEAIERTDEHRKLSRKDAENAAAMVYHITPDVKYG
jgi:hypothetical protein